MEANFGWKYGYYGEHYTNKNILAPNISIYCKTPVLIPDDRTYVDVHIINAIGYAFDSIHQPDYKYFVNGSKQNELRQRYIKVFERIYSCAMDKSLDTVVMSLVGANNFATLYEDTVGKSIDYFQRTVVLLV